MDHRRARRRSIRLAGYNYSQPGAYFLTICADRRACLFGAIVSDAVQLNQCGMIVKETWDGLPAHYPNVTLDAFVVMPNHVHGIIILTDDVGAGFKPAPTSTAKRYALSEIVRGFKTFSARRINVHREVSGVPVWQRNYYEHVIRDESTLNRIRQYVAENPARWADDPENPHAGASSVRDRNRTRR